MQSAIHAPIRSRLLAAMFAALTLIGLGCGHDEPSRPIDQGPADVGGALVPSVLEQGESISVTLFGAVPSGGVAALGEARIVRQPSGDFGAVDARAGEVEISVFSRANPGSSAVSNPTVPFSIETTLPALTPGAWILRLRNAAGDVHETPFQIVERGVWVRYRSFGDPVLADLDLAVTRSGMAIARLEGTPPRAGLPLTQIQVDLLRQVFDDTAFRSLDNQYLSVPPAAGRRIEITLQGDQARKHVLAEAALMPAKLQVLEMALRELTQTVLADTPVLMPVYGRLGVDPLRGAPGTARRLTLTLVNESEREVTLHFANGLQFDVAIVRPMRGQPGQPDHVPGGEPGPDGVFDPSGDPSPEPPDAVLWRLSHLADPDPNPTSLAIPAGGTVEFEAEWNGTAENGVVVGAGVYECAGRVPAIDRRIPVLPVRFGVSGETPVGALELELSVEPVAGPPGTARVFTLSATNPTDRELQFEFRSTQQYDFALDDPRVSAPGPGNIWLWSRGKGFGDVIQTITWAPHETKTFVETWDGRRNRMPGGTPGGVVGAGGYSLVGVLTKHDELRSRAARLIVTQP